MECKNKTENIMVQIQNVNNGQSVDQLRITSNEMPDKKCP